MFEVNVVNSIVGRIEERVMSKREDEIFEYIVDFCIVDWKKVVLDGKELKCTRANKIKILKNVPAITQFVSDCLESLENGPKKKVAIKSNRLIFKTPKFTGIEKEVALRHYKKFQDKMLATFYKKISKSEE